MKFSNIFSTVLSTSQMLAHLILEHTYEVSTINILFHRWGSDGLGYVSKDVLVIENLAPYYNS